MRIVLSMMFMLTFMVSCQKGTGTDFLSDNRKKVTIGYMKYADTARRSEGSSATDADVAVKASVEYINKAKLFPFQIDLLTLDFGSDMQENLDKFNKSNGKVAAWISTKDTKTNMAIGTLSLSSRVPVFFPITSKTLFTQGYPNLYQATPSNGAYGLKTWYLADKMNLKKILVIKDSSIIYSDEYSSTFQTINDLNNDKIRAQIVSGNFAKDEEEILAKVNDALRVNSFDAVFFPGFAKDISSVLGVMQSLNLRIPILVGDEGSDVSTIFSSKIKGYSKVYFLSYYPAKLSGDNNPKTKNRIDNFNKFNEESGRGSLSTLQLYFSTPLIIGEIINKALEETPNFPTKEDFYDKFNEVAKNGTFTGLLDRPIRFTTAGTISIPDQGLFIMSSSKKEGNKTEGTL